MKESLLELFWLIKTCLTTFWFWLPILIALYGVVEIWMFVYIHPFSIFVLPTIVAAYALSIESRRKKAQYRPLGPGHVGAPFPVGSTSEFTPNWNAEQKINEYLKTLDEENRKTENGA